MCYLNPQQKSEAQAAYDAGETKYGRYQLRQETPDYGIGKAWKNRDTVMLFKNAPAYSQGAVPTVNTDGSKTWNLASKYPGLPVSGQFGGTIN